MPPVKDISENATPQTFWERSRKYLFIGIIFLLAGTMIMPALNRGHSTGSTVAIVNGEKISHAEYMSYQGQWAQLSRLGMKSQTRDLPVIAILPMDAIQQIESHKDLYMLLAVEARAAGIRASKDDVMSFLQNSVHLPPNLDADMEDSLIHSISTLFTVQRMYLRAASAAKVSQPLVDTEIATQLTDVDIEFVELVADEFMAGLPDPTPEQLQAQFKQYAETLALTDLNSRSDENNPMGIGYKLPNRVKLQYIGFSKDSLEKATLASKSEYDWEVIARKYYIEHPDEFKKAPTASADPNAKLEDLMAKQSFDAVKAQILAKLQKQEQATLATRIRNRLEQQLPTDYVASESKAATQSSTPPNTRYGVPYRSPEYFSKLAAAIQQEMGVVMTVASIQDSSQTAVDLGRLAGISTTVTSSGTPFTEYATKNVVPLVPKDGPRPQGKVLALYEPSGVMTDSVTGAQYFFRVTDAQATVAPSEMPAETVKADWRKLQGFEAAKKTAEELAKQVAAASLEEAGKSAGRYVKQAGKVRLIQPTINGLLVSPASQELLRQGLVRATSHYQAGVKNPTVIALPRDRKVLVVSVKASRANTFGLPADVLAADLRTQITRYTQQMVAPDWFDYEQAKARTGYKPVAGY